MLIFIHLYELKIEFIKTIQYCCIDPRSFKKFQDGVIQNLLLILVCELPIEFLSFDSKIHYQKEHLAASQSKHYKSNILEKSSK